MIFLSLFIFFAGSKRLVFVGATRTGMIGSVRNCFRVDSLTRNRAQYDVPVQWKFHEEPGTPLALVIQDPILRILHLAFPPIMTSMNANIDRPAGVKMHVSLRKCNDNAGFIELAVDGFVKFRAGAQAALYRG